MPRPSQITGSQGDASTAVSMELMFQTALEQAETQNIIRRRPRHTAMSKALDFRAAVEKAYLRATALPSPTGSVQNLDRQASAEAIVAQRTESGYVLLLKTVKRSVCFAVVDVFFSLTPRRRLILSGGSGLVSVPVSHAIASQLCCVPCTWQEP